MGQGVSFLGLTLTYVASGPLLGNVESGVVAAFAGIRASAVSGGVLCVIGVALTALVLPAFWRYDARWHAPEAQTA